MLSTVIGIAVLASPSCSIKVDGDGYMRFMREEEVVFAKQMTLTIAEGKLCSKSGPIIVPVIKVESIPDSLSVSLDGTVTGQYGAESKKLGRLVLADFTDDIRPVESKGFLKAFGKAHLGEPGEGLFGVIRPWTPPKEEQSFVKVYDPSQKVPPKTGDENDKESSTKTERTETSDEMTVKAVPPSIEFLKSGGVQVNLRESLEVSGSSVYLGQIGVVFANAQIANQVSGITLTTVPPLGIERKIDRTLILAKLRNLGIDPGKVKIIGPTQCIITREGQDITQAEFIQAAIEAASKEFSDLEVLNDESVRALRAPKGEKQLVAEDISMAGSTINVRVVAYVDGTRVNSRTIRLANKHVPMTLNVGDKVTAVIMSNDVRVEVSATVRRVNKATGEVTVKTETGATLMGRITKEGTVEVKA